MGSSSWSDKHYKERVNLRTSSGRATFEHHEAIRSGSVKVAAHTTLDPSKLKAGKRESRDSKEHPESNPVFIGLDVTGSMASVPDIIQKSLPKLMGLLLRKGYLIDPSICISGIGDIKFDKVPIQIGQFESGIEIEDDLTNLYLEGGGGGNRHESYEIMLYFLSCLTSTDSWEKRKKKGYAFIICDEELAQFVDRKEVVGIFGQEQAFEPVKLTIEDVLKAVLEKWELYCIIPHMTSHYKDSSYSARWRELLGERVLMLEEPEGISELIASTIGVLEDVADLSSIVTDMTTEGTSSSVANAVGTALASVGNSRGLSKMNKDTGLTTLS